MRRTWIQPGAIVRLDPIGVETEGRLARVYEIRDTGLVLIGAVKGKTGHALVHESLIDVPVKAAPTVRPD